MSMDAMARAELQKLSKAELIERVLEATERRSDEATKGTDSATGLVLVLPAAPDEAAEAPLVRRIDVNLQIEEAEGYRRMFELTAGRMPVGTPDGRMVSDRPDVLRWIFRTLARAPGLGEALQAAEQRFAERRAIELQAEADAKNAENAKNANPQPLALD